MRYINKLWSNIWPIHDYELKKFLPIALIKFCFIFTYCILHSLKDSLVVPSIGAESISFLKFWGAFPSAIIFMLIYSELTNKYTVGKVFYIITYSFLLLLVIFAFILYPFQHHLHPSPDSIIQWTKQYPNFKWIILIYGKWTYAFLYILAELWGSVTISLLFWQFANQITKTEEARRFYPLLGFLGQLSLFFAGQLIKIFAIDDPDIEEFARSISLIQSSLSCAIVSGVAATLIYSWINKNILTDPNFYIPKVAPISNKIKPTLSQSLKTILLSKYLGLLALLVICYGISINLIEGPWKAKLQEYYPTKTAYAEFMGNFYIWTGFLSATFCLIGGNIVRNFSWLTCALITPVMMLITGTAFYIFVVFPHLLDSHRNILFGFSALFLSIIIGTIQNILAKSSKYSLFDSTKEIAYIPIDEELKVKGKAAVDVVGSRFGKSGAALIQTLIFMVIPSANYTSIAPYLMIFFLIITLIWIKAVIALNKEYLKHEGSYNN